MAGSLRGSVALVAGATRAAGRGIAVQLGAAGATVYCTGRSTRSHRSSMNRPETIEDTAEMVTAVGGRGIPVQVDHTEPGQVQALVQRIAAEQHGRLDVVVNDVWGGDRLTEWGTPFWRHSLTAGLDMLHNGLDSHLITSWHAAPLMLARGSGLIVGMTDGHTPRYRDSLFYDLVKSSVIRLAVGQGCELGARGVTAVALTPGWIRSERILEREGVTEDNWQDAYLTGQVANSARGWLASESPSYVGRAVAALATDPDVARWNGQVLTSWDLAEEYGFTDLNGTRPRFEDRTVEVLDALGAHLRRDDYSDKSHP